MTENGAVQLKTIQLPLTMIGRDADNHIVIQDRKASRHHARIETREGNYWVVDLNSTNGTYYSNRRLEPGVSEIWNPEEELRIGDTYFRLLIADQNVQLPQDFHRRSPDNDQQSHSHTTGTASRPIFLQLEENRLSISPGDDADVNLVIQNLGDYVDIYNITLTGIDSTWYEIRSTSLSILPGEQKRVTIRFLPPQNSDTRAGSYPVTVRASSRRASSDFVEADLNLTITEFLTFGSSISPTVLQAGATGQITIHNQGNSLESYSVYWQDPSKSLVFTPPKPVFRVQGGEEILAEFRVDGKKQPIFSGNKKTPFSAEIRSGSGRAQVHQAELVSRAIFPLWMISFAAIILFAIGAFGLSFIFSRGEQTLPATQTIQYVNTQVGAAVQQTRDAAAAFATATKDFDQTTPAAATATAIWLIGDDDGDGLRNQEELTYGTSPVEADTDQDGLDDREELVQWNTDPLNPDTDNDSIQDGIEVNQGLDPLRPDTDRDGIPDSEDPSPLRKSTPTIDIQASQTAAIRETEHKAATQTAIVLNATTDAAAQLTSAILKTAQAAQSQTQTVQAMSHLVYIYSTDESAANDFKSFLQSKGYRVDLINQENIILTDFATYDAILIGRETGSTSEWGDDPGIQAGMLQSTGRPILGFGEGGYAFFGKIDLMIGYDNGAHSETARCARLSDRVRPTGENHSPSAFRRML